MQTARDDRAGKFICHGLRRFIIGGRLHLVDINAVAVTLGVDDARGELRRDDRLLIHTRELRVERAAVAGLADGFADAVDADDHDDTLRLLRDHRLMGSVRLERQALGTVRLDKHKIRKLRQRAH